MFKLHRKEPYRPESSNVQTALEFIRELVHEIRNPLNSISANLQLLEEDIHSDINANIEGRDSFLKRLDLVKGELKRLDQILNDFLRLARLPSIRLEVADLRAVLEEVLDFIEPESQRQGIKIHRKFDHPIPKFQFDKLQIKQALLNLILNANQSMPSGGELTVSVELAGQKAKISISDTGCGIQEEIKDKIFEPFFSTKKEGTGLGLNIVKQIIDQHGGKLEFTTEVGKGTSFYLFLPLK